MTTLILADNDSGNLGNLFSNVGQIRPHWQISKMTSGKQVLTFTTANEVDCIVSESALSDMNGLDLLKSLQSKGNQSVRFVMALNAGDDSALEFEQARHSLIYGTTTEDELIASIETSLRLRKMLDANSVSECMDQIDTLPSLPDVYQSLVDELTSPQSSLISVAEIIESDVGLTATVMKIVNSAFYGLNRKVESVSQGVTFLGSHLIKNITLTTKVFSQFEGGNLEMQQLRLLNDQANKTGALANHFARLARVPKTVVDHTQIAGMLGNCGTLLAMSQSSEVGGARHDIQHELLGAYLLRSWQMPDCVVEAVAFQHETPPATAHSITPLLVLHTIRFLEKNKFNFDDACQWQEACDYLEKLVGQTLATEWLEAYRDLQQLTAHHDLDESRTA